MNNNNGNKKTGSGLGSLIAGAWSRYSFIFVFAIILVVYALTIRANGNTFKWSHVAALKKRPT